ncbi:MAG: DUF1080 domain-containing protein, partial [Verrucomicrobiae bacterium]|nr:DUF1080 domain-containing protein [Verrucomicrobiae bacterium]
MKKNIPLLFSFAAAVVATFSGPFAAAQDGAGEFQSLFDGGSLDGWKGLDFWSVSDGVIVGETTAEKPTSGNTFLVWQGGEVADFEFVCQVRFKGNNSGVQYRSGTVDAEKFVLAGYQADLHPKPEYFGMLYGEKMGKRGIIAQRGQRVEIAADGAVKVVGQVGDGATLAEWEWNELRIVAVGNRLIHLVNGVVTADVTDEHPEKLAKGVLGLQLHAGPPMRVEFKDLKLRQLSGDTGKAVLQKTLDSQASVRPKAAMEPASGTAAIYEMASADPPPSWIWRADKTDNEPLFFRKTFDAPSKIAKAALYATCDNFLELWINGERVGEAPDWGNPILRDDVAALLKPGRNVVAARCQNRGGVAAFVLKLAIDGVAPEPGIVLTDETWKTSPAEAEGWKTAAFDDSGWTTKLKNFGKFGVGPWGVAGKRTPSGGAPAKKSPLEPGDITVAEGFKVELLHTVPKDEQGSWVSLTKDGQGRLLASDQGDKGLYRVSVAESASGPKVTVEKMPAEISGAHGMVWAFDALWFHRSGGPLYRVTDSNGDGRLDKAEEMPASNGGGEHGNHAVIVTEDGGRIYVDAGNHTNLPPDEAMAGSRVTTWDEDLLLPRQWDARGHARGRLAPGGWVTRFDPETRKHELYCVGFRNEYDIALNRNDDLFTYDADMEWDMGMPWYRPTRICLAQSGADFGWRSGSGKWPDYYEDSLPALVDIGPGSPTGVVFGIGSKFPPRYQDALFALDWTFGTIYAIHITPEGAGYVATPEEFVSGAPLPLTDAIVGLDGALYFTTGGRGTQSGLYRVT